VVADDLNTLSSAANRASIADWTVSATAHHQLSCSGVIGICDYPGRAATVYISGGAVPQRPDISSRRAH